MSKKRLEDFVKASANLEQQAMNIIAAADNFMNPAYQYLALLKDLSSALDYGDALVNKTKCLMNQGLSYRERNVATIPIWLTMAAVFKNNKLPAGISPDEFNQKIQEMILQTNELRALYNAIHKKKSTIASLRAEDERLKKELLVFSEKDPSAKQAESNSTPGARTEAPFTPPKRPDFFKNANPFEGGASGLKGSGKKKEKYEGNKQDYTEIKGDSIAEMGKKQKARTKIEVIKELYLSDDEFRKEINKKFLLVDEASKDVTELTEALSYDKTLDKIDEMRVSYEAKIREAARNENAFEDEKINFQETVAEAIMLLTEQKARDPNAGIYVYDSSKGVPTTDQINQSFEIFWQGLQPAINDCRSDGPVPKQLQYEVEKLNEEFTEIDVIVKNRKAHLDNMKGRATASKDDSTEKSALQAECEEIVVLIEQLLEEEFDYDCVIGGFKSLQETQSALDKHAAAQKQIISEYDKLHKCIAALEDCLNSGRKYLDEPTIKKVTKIITKSKKNADKLERKFMEIAAGITKITKSTAKHGIGIKDPEAKKVNEPNYFENHQKDLEKEEAALAEQAEKRRGFKH